MPETAKDLKARLVQVDRLTAFRMLAGLVIVIDEARTLLRMKSDVRQQSLNAPSFPGLLWGRG